MTREKKPEPRNDEPVQRSVHVDAPVAEAFELFTERFDEWWPLAEHGEIEPRTVKVWVRHAASPSSGIRIRTKRWTWSSRPKAMELA